MYAAGALHGLAVVSFPASSAELRETYGLSDQAYGSLFLPQMIFTIAGSLAGGVLARKLGLRTLLACSLVLAMASQICLRSVGWIEPRIYVLLLGTAFMGAGFGLGAAPLNALPALLFPRRGGPALVALHTMIGAGFALGPLGVSALSSNDLWTLFPVFLALLTALVAAAAWRASLPSPPSPLEGTRAALPWGALAIFVVIAIVYSLAEGTFANWAIVFLAEDRGVSAELAAVALSSFWAALAGGRLLVSALLTRVGPGPVWVALPLAMIAIFLALPMAHDAFTGIVLFALAGLACSAFFPLTVEMASREDPNQTAAISSMMVASLMIGVGGGSFALGSLREAFDLPSLYRLSALEPALAAILCGVVLLRRAKWST